MHGPWKCFPHDSMKGPISTGTGSTASLSAAVTVLCAQSVFPPHGIRFLLTPQQVITSLLDRKFSPMDMLIDLREAGVGVRAGGETLMREKNTSWLPYIHPDWGPCSFGVGSDQEQNL